MRNFDQNISRILLGKIDTSSYIWDPKIVGEEVLPHIIPWLDPEVVNALSPVYREDIDRIEYDPMTAKRRAENHYNNGEKIGSDDPRDANYFKIDWRVVYETLKEGNKAWEELFFTGYDNPDYARLAIAMGADPTDNDNTPLSWNSRERNIEVVDFLLQDPRVVATVPNMKLGIALRSGSVLAAQLLLDKGIDDYAVCNIVINLLGLGGKQGMIRSRATTKKPSPDRIANVLVFLLNSDRVKSISNYPMIARDIRAKLVKMGYPVPETS